MEAGEKDHKIRRIRVQELSRRVSRGGRVLPIQGKLLKCRSDMTGHLRGVGSEPQHRGSDQGAKELPKKAQRYSHAE